MPSRKHGLDDEERVAIEREVLSGLAKLGYTVSSTDLGKLNPPDIYEAELEVMAEVRAYFQVAYKVNPFAPCVMCILNMTLSSASLTMFR